MREREKDRGIAFASEKAEIKLGCHVASSCLSTLSHIGLESMIQLSFEDRNVLWIDTTGDLYSMAKLCVSLLGWHEHTAHGLNLAC